MLFTIFWSIWCIISVVAGIVSIYFGITKAKNPWQTMLLYIIGVGLISSGVINL